MTKARTNADNASADIQGVTAGTGLSGGGTSGTVTLDVDTAVIQARVANVTDTEIGYLDGVTSAIQTQLDGKIANTLTTTTGDIIYASGANTPARLGIGSSGQVLSVSSGIPAWATPSNGAMTELASGSLSGSSVTLSSISQGYKNLELWIKNFYASSNANFLINANASSGQSTVTNTYDASNQDAGNDDMYISSNFYNPNSSSFIQIKICDYTGSHAKKVEGSYVAIDTGGTFWYIGNRQGIYKATTAISSLVLKPSTGNFTSGSYVLYGVK